jgi:hypothetical protein
MSRNLSIPRAYAKGCLLHGHRSCTGDASFSLTRKWNACQRQVGSCWLRHPDFSRILNKYKIFPYFGLLRYAIISQASVGVKLRVPSVADQGFGKAISSFEQRLLN